MLCPKLNNFPLALLYYHVKHAERAIDRASHFSRTVSSPSAFRRCLITYAPPVLSLGIADRLPLEIRNRVRSAAGERLAPLQAPRPQLLAGSRVSNR
jgi:hypothetical protein